MQSIADTPWTLKRFITYAVQPYRWHLLALTMIQLCSAAGYSIEAYAMRWLFNNMQACDQSRTISCVIVPVLLYLANAFVLTILFRVWDIIMLYVEPKIESRSFTTLMHQLMGHPATFHQDRLAGSLINKVNDIAKGIPELIRLFIAKFFKTACMIIIALTMLAFLFPFIALIVFIWFVLALLNAAYAAPRVYNLSEYTAEERSEVTGHATDVALNMLSVRLFAKQQYETGFIQRLLAKWVKADQATRWVLSQAFIIQAALWMLHEVILITWILYEFKHGSLSIGDIALILSLSMAITNEIWTITPDVIQLMQTVGSVSQGISTIMVPHQLQDQPQALPLTVSNATIVYDQVTFGYQSDRPVFNNLSLTIKSGEKVGLVGYSGSGKSTFVNLLLRLFDVEKGTILIDGQDIRKVTQDSLHKAITLVPQDPSLFHRSLADNIRYGYLAATDIEVEAAAHHAHADTFINALPQGYQTLVGDRGVKLSGGQRQRIAIARAFLKPAKVLVMDEATSALDSVTEREIQISLQELMKGHTTVVIAHRLTTLLMMDRLLVLDQGRIVEDGTHTKLLEDKGLYWQLWNTQKDGFIPTNRS